ncbi:MAG: DUF86 domain-containing protein [Burkholderiales bacterium]
MKRDKALRVADYAGHMIDAARRIVTYTAGLTRDEFLAASLIQDAVIRNFEIIGEAARNIELIDPGFPNQHPHIEWSAAQGMRHRLAHGYFKVNLDVVWIAIERDIPELLRKLEALLPTLRGLNSSG